jgi:hypothetical protein
MGQKMRRFDLPNCGTDQSTELAPLLVGDRGSQVLDLDQAFAHEYHLGNFRDSSDPE